MKDRLYLFCAVMLVGFGGGACRSMEMALPPDFVMHESKAETYRAVTADGIAIRAEIEKNDPQSDPALWMAAFRQHLERRGYQIEAAEAVQSDSGMSGQLVRAVYRYENQEYVYWCAIYTKGSALYTVEIAGPAQLARPRQAEFLKLLRTFKRL